MPLALKVENLSKVYRLGEIGTGTLSHDLKRWWAKQRGQEDPFLKIGETNDRTIKGSSDIVWSLKDINFEINQGDAVGIIGRNGAGKSTLLKILSRITSPTTGTITGEGRIASLLEVGTGFHPELTGRENIYLNGSILGMRKREIKTRFDEIVDFAGIERYIDTPVKRYSSGMYVRLAFAVAAHLESEVLIVDEVLAVGDAEFQKKCLGKMSDVSKGEGRTVLFVSHNMAAVQKLCSKGILLRNGKIEFSGPIENTVNKYLELRSAVQAEYDIPKPVDYENLPGYAYRIQVEDLQGNSIIEIPVGKPWQVRVFLTLVKPVKHFIVGLGMVNSLEVNMRTTWSNEIDCDEGNYEAVFKEENVLFAVGSYHLILGLSTYETTFHWIENVATIHISDVVDNSLDKTIIRTEGVGMILNPMKVNLYKV
jgi:ABC-type polysaccharide/polyol phosphate transport system ATPase subunit